MKLSFFFLLLVSFFTSAQAAYVLKDGKLIHADYAATLSVQEHYTLAIQAYQEQNWEALEQQAMILLKNFADSPFVQDIHYYLGAAKFGKRDLLLANQYFSTYLKQQSTPKFFEEAIQYKFKIAQSFQKGEKKHLMGWEALPKWLPAREEAIAIYDEVITALPHHELAAEALFGKAQLQLREEDYKSSIETYQTLIRRFPKHPLSIEGFIGISEAYLIQSRQDYPDQDLLDSAELNIQKFHESFPTEPKVAVAEKLLYDMQEVYASQLYDIGRFYERTGKPQASRIYYTRILAKYPQTPTAQCADRRLKKLKIPS